MNPTKIAFGFPNGVKRFTGPRVISMSPVILEYDTNDGVVVWRETSECIAHRIIVSGSAPQGVLDTSTTFSFEVQVVPPDEDPYMVRFFYEEVEWKDVTKGFEWRSSDWIWDDFVSDWMGGEWPKPIEFLGIARQVDRGPSDPRMGELSHGAKFIGGFYRL